MLNVGLSMPKII